MLNILFHNKYLKSISYSLLLFLISIIDNTLPIRIKLMINITIQYY